MKWYRAVFFLTEKCNKKCFYCDIGQLENPKAINKETFQWVFNDLNGRDDLFQWFTLTGGEPGLVDYDILEYFFDNVCKCHKVRVNTNGDFIQKGYFDKWYDKIDAIGYHPTIEVGDPIDPYICDDKIMIFQPIHSKNIDKVEEQLIKYPSLKWNLIPFLKKREFFEDDSYVISNEQFKQYYPIFMQYDNVEKWTLNTLQKFSTFNDNLIYLNRRTCGNMYLHPVFNFVHNKIHRCPISYTYNDRVELNKENLNKLKSFSLFNDSDNDKSCMRCNDVLRYHEYYWNNIKSKYFKGL